MFSLFISLYMKENVDIMFLELMTALIFNCWSVEGMSGTKS